MERFTIGMRFIVADIVVMSIGSGMAVFRLFLSVHL